MTDKLMSMGIKLEISTSNEWHVLKGKDQYGPYTYETMLTMLQQNTLFGFDYVWSPHMESWTQLFDLAEFSPDRISNLAKNSNDTNVFFRRNHERAACDWQTYIHDDRKLWPGKIESISVGGALILMMNPLLLPGDILTIHMPASSELKTPFNAKGEVLTKRLTKERVTHDSQIYYAFKFTQVQTFGEKQIQEFINIKHAPHKGVKS